MVQKKVEEKRSVRLKVKVATQEAESFGFVVLFFAASLSCLRFLHYKMPRVGTRARSSFPIRGVHFADSAVDQQQQITVLPDIDDDDAADPALSELAKRVWPSKYISEQVFARCIVWLFVLQIAIVFVLGFGVLPLDTQSPDQMGKMSHGMMTLSMLGVNHERLVYRCASAAAKYPGLSIFSGVCVILLLYGVLFCLIDTRSKSCRHCERRLAEVRAQAKLSVH